MSSQWTQDRAADEAIDLKRLLAGVARRKYWIIIPTVAALLASLAFIILVHPRYTGVAKVLLENQESYYTRPDKATADPTPNLDPEGVQSEAETITSPDLAREAIAKLGLADKPEFNQAPTNPLSMILAGLMGGGAKQSGEGRIVDAFLSRLTAFPVAKTRV